MMTAAPKRSFFQTAVYSFFALYLGVTPPAPGKERFYAGLLLGALILIAACGYFFMHLLMHMMLG
jgi:hypothetical protein